MKNAARFTRPVSPNIISQPVIPVTSLVSSQPQSDSQLTAISQGPQNQSAIFNVSSPSASTFLKQRHISRRTFLDIASVITMGITGLSILGSWLKVELEASKSFVPSNPSSFSPGYTFNIYRGHRHTNNVDGNVNGVAWSPDSKRIASASFDYTVQVWDAINGDNLMIYTGHTEHVNDVAWSPDGKYIASCSGESDGKDCTVQVWDASNGKRISILNGHSNNVNAVAWSPNGKYIASANYNGTVLVSEAMTGKKIYTYAQHMSPVFTVAWSPDGHYIASGSNRGQIVQVWEPTTGKLVATYGGHTSGILSVVWLPNFDSKYIASGSSDNTVKVWEAVTGNNAPFSTKNLNGAVRRVACSPDGKYIAAGTLNSTVEVWDAKTGQDLFPSYTDYLPDVQINALAWSPNESMIASGGSDSTVHVWQAI